MSIKDLFRVPFPNQEWLKKNNTTEFTPDLYKLEGNVGHVLFEYGDMHNRTIKDFCLPLPAYTVDKYTMLKSRSTPFINPLVLSTSVNTTAERARLKGRMYFAELPNLIDLDNQKQNGVQFTRERVKLMSYALEETRKETLRPIIFTAWMYLGIKTYWEPQLQWDTDFYGSSKRNERSRNFIPVRTIKDDRQWLGSYYDYLKDQNLDAALNKCFLYFHRNLADPPMPKIEEKPVVIKDHRAA
jgi:hypothetical protein